MSFIDKKLFWVLLEEISYLSQNSFFSSKNLVIYLKQIALQNEITFIQIWDYDWAASGVALVQWLVGTPTTDCELSRYSSV